MALNEGRALFPKGDNERFGEWVANVNLAFAVDPHERAAAMWAAANPDQFAAARAAGNARTVRGIHAKWNEINAERAAEQERAKAEEARRAPKLSCERPGASVLANRTKKRKMVRIMNKYV